METTKFLDTIEQIGKDLGYDVKEDIEYDIENTATVTFSENKKVYLTVVEIYGGVENKINFYDAKENLILEDTIRGVSFVQKNWQYLVDKVSKILNDNVKNILNTPEKVYDYGEENNWQGLEQKHYEILSQDKNLAQMAVADMQDKGIVVPDILKQFRRYSMSFKDVLISKIAKEKKETKKLTKKAAWSDVEKKQVGALDDNAVGKFNIYQDKAGEIFVTKHKLNDNFVLMDTAETFDDIQEKIERDWQDSASYVGYDKELLNDKSIWQFADYEGDENGIVDLSKDYATEKKAAEEDLDVKLKVQKNKPAGLDTSSPKSLPESIRPLMQDLKGKISDVKEIETQLAARKAELDAKYQEAKNESKIVEKQAEIENLTNNIGKLLFAAKNETFQFQDNLVALTHQTKVVPAKATDKWKFEKVFEKLKSLMGDENAQKFLDATLNGLQSQATEKTITELNIFSPTQKQMKQSDTSDTNKFIDALKEIYVNLRSYFLDVKKANNILEEQLATGATASKKQVVTKKAEYKAEEDVLFKMMEDFEIFTPGEIEVGITVGGRNLETAEAMLFSRTGLRSLTQLKDDLRNGGTDQETLDSYMVGDIEDTEIESKKKVNLKKAKVADIRERIKRYKQNKDEKVLNILNKMNEQDLKKTIKEYRRALFDQKETYTPEQEEIRHYLFDIDNQEMTLKQVKENLESKKKVKVGKEAKKEFVDINGKTWKEFLDNIKNEGYTFDEKLYEKKVTTIPKVITVSKGEHSDKVVAYWNDDREEYGIAGRMDA